MHILVIDDVALLAQALRRMLTAEGHRVVTALAGNEGIDLFRAAHDAGDPFTVVLTDYSMSDVDGLEVAAAVKRVSSAVSVILLTAYEVHPGDERPAHVDAMLTKPPSLEALVAVLAESQTGSTL